MSNIKFISDKDNKKTITLSDLSKSKQIEMKRGKVIAKTDGKYPVYSSSVKNNGLMCYSNDYMFDEELISWSIDGGGDFFYRPKHKYSLTNVSGYIRIKDKNIDYKYLYSILSFLHQKYHFDYTTKAHPSVISKLYHIPLPKIEIQQKIGNLLFFIDKKLNYELYIIQNLKDIKKAMLEKMFPKENSNIPELRFKGFTETWEQRKLGEISNSYSGGTPTVGKKDYYGGNIPFIRSGEISCDKTELFITNEGVNSSSAKMVTEGDILYALYGATSGEVSISKMKGAINQAILAIQPHQNYDSQFIMQWLRKSKESIISTYLQGGQGNLSGNIVKELLINLPNYDEQKQIGDFFSKIDSLITLHQRKYDKLVQVKKALLNKMFV